MKYRFHREAKNFSRKTLLQSSFSIILARKGILLRTKIIVSRNSIKSPPTEIAM